MKKLILMFAAIAAVSFASCGNKQAEAEKAKADSIRIADSIAAVEAAALEAEAAKNAPVVEQQPEVTAEEAPAAE